MRQRLPQKNSNVAANVDPCTDKVVLEVNHRVKLPQEQADLSQGGYGCHLDQGPGRDLGPHTQCQTAGEEGGESKRLVSSARWCMRLHSV